MVRSERNLEENVSQSDAIAELMTAVRELKENLSRLVGAGKNVAGEQMGRIRDGAGDMLRRGRDRVSDAATSTRDYVQEEPVKALVFAAAAGAIIGWLVNRSRR